MMRNSGIDRCGPDDFDFGLKAIYDPAGVILDGTPGENRGKGYESRLLPQGHGFETARRRQPAEAAFTLSGTNHQPKGSGSIDTAKGVIGGVAGVASWMLLKNPLRRLSSL